MTDSQTDSLHCGICFKKYDRELIIPTSLPQCGHTCCKECIKNIMRTQYPSPRCPFCKRPFIGRPSMGFLVPHPNYAVLSSLQETFLFGQCQEHSLPYEWVCEKDQQFVCSKCCIIGQHKGHEVRELDVAKREHGNTLELLENEKKVFQDTLVKDESERNKRKHEELQAIEDDFNEKEAILKKQKLDQQSKLLQKYEEEEKDHSTRFEVITAIDGVIAQYKTTTPQNICRIQKVNVKNFTQEYLKKLNLTGRKSSTQDFSNLSGDITQPLVDSHTFKLPTTISLLAKKVSYLPTALLNANHISCFSFEVVDDELKIVIQRAAIQANYQGLIAQKKIQRIKLGISNVQLSTADFEFLSDILNYFKSIQSMTLEFDPQIIRPFEMIVSFRKELTSLMRLLFAKTAGLISLDFNWNSMNEHENVVMFLIREILPTLSRLKTLKLSMPIKKLDSPNLQQLGLIDGSATFDLYGIKNLLVKFKRP